MHWLKALFLSVAIVSTAVPAHAADTYPSQPIRIVVTIGAGSAADILARLLGDELGRQLGQPVIVDNRPGAGGNIAADFVAKSPADGYTLLMASVSTHGINPALHKKLPFDPVKDFAPIGLLAANPNVLIVSPSLQAKTLRDLIELARQRPGDLTYASGGNGTSQHLAGELLASLAGIRLLHVPYKSTPLSVNAVLSGEVTMAFASVPVVLPHVKAGKVKALGITSAKQLASWPEVPTIASQGLPTFDVSAWFGLMGPAGTSQTVITRLNGTLARILAMPEIRHKLQEQGMEVLGGSSVDFERTIRSEIERWGKIVRASGASLD